MSTVSSSLSIYRVGGSLPINAPSYVKRQADQDLYRLLKEGEFCYVLNSRQMGKSSLWVQTMVRLQGEGLACAALDLTAIGSLDISREEWYAGVIDELVSRFNLYESFDLEGWWTRQGLLSPTQKLGKFFTEILLKQVKEKIVIFIDEIDSTLKLPFKDDFFALIRACYNQRVDNEDYNRLTFCLLGVASPSDLIEDKQSTPFNIGKAIELTGFELEEVTPLIRGLEEKVDNPPQIMKDILFWTGGQPFLTQRLCNLVVNQSKFKPNLSELVTHHIIDNWESQDEQEHLKTIKNRLLSNERKAGELLELYRQIRQQEKWTAQNSSEERALQLSGLVVKTGGKLRVYNPIYERVFNEGWIDEELRKLRPYAGNFRAWMASGKTETSWLLRGKALEEAWQWAEEKNLSGDDRDFISASRTLEREEEIAQKEKEAELERERKGREAAEKAKNILEEANHKAKNQIHFANKLLILIIDKVQGIRNIGLIILALTFVGGLFCSGWVIKAERKAKKINSNIKVVMNLSDLAGKLQREGKSIPYNDALVQAGLSFKYDYNSPLKPALLSSSISLAYQHLEQWDKAEEALTKSLKLVESNKNLFTSTEGIPIAFFTYSVQGNFLEECNSLKECKLSEEMNNSSPQSAYEKAVQYLPKTLSIDLTRKISEMVTLEEIVSAYNSLDNSLHNDKEEDLRNLVQASLKKHYNFRTKQLIKQLEDLLEQEDLPQHKDWKKADEITWNAILFSAKSKNVDGFSYSNISCSDLKKIDELWYNHSKGKYGFRVQKEIWEKLGSPTVTSPSKEWSKFYIMVGWKTEESGTESGEEYVNYLELGGFQDYKSSKKAYIPWGAHWVGLKGRVEKKRNGRRIEISKESLISLRLSVGVGTDLMQKSVTCRI